MKKFIAFIFTIALVSCASVKTSKVEVTPVGNWDYSITGTPEGDFNGGMTISVQDNNYSASMNTRGSELNIDKFFWNKETSKIGGQFNYSGYLVYFDATLSGEELTGNMSVEGQSFPFKATRKK